MKILCTALLVFFISFQTQAQSEGGDGVPVNNTNKTDTNDLANKIVKRINSCDDTACLVTFYNSMAKVCSGFSNKESGKKIIAEILKLMDKKMMEYYLMFICLKTINIKSILYNAQNYYQMIYK